MIFYPCFRLTPGFFLDLAASMIYMRKKVFILSRFPGFLFPDYLELGFVGTDLQGLVLQQLFRHFEKPGIL